MWLQVVCLRGVPLYSYIKWCAVSLKVSLSPAQSAVRGCEKMLGDWLEGREEVRRPLTWGTLTEALKETGEFQTLANDIETGLNNLEH